MQPSDPTPVLSPPCETCGAKYIPQCLCPATPLPAPDHAKEWACGWCGGPLEPGVSAPALAPHGEAVAWRYRLQDNGPWSLTEDRRITLEPWRNAMPLTEVEALFTHPAPAARVTSEEVNIGLHTRVELRYEVDRYSAELIHENEKVLAEAHGETPSLALAALTAALSAGGK